MAKKKTEHKSKTFTEALGLNNIINDKTGFVAGLILLCVAIYICVAFFSYFSTGAADIPAVKNKRVYGIYHTASRSLADLASAQFIAKTLYR